MKKFFITLGVAVIFLSAGILVKQTGLFAEPSLPDSVSQEADRNRELLEIWKEHVKTLTKERDDAYRQVEHMRANSATPGASGQFGMESMPIPSPQATQQIQGLEAEVTRLQGELQRKNTGDASRELQMQYSALQNQFSQVKKDLNEARSEKDRIIQEKERALSKAERLESENEGLRTDGGGSAPAPVQNDSEASESSDKDKDSFARRARELQYENETLKAHIEKLEVVEKELSNTRGYFTPLVKDLQDKFDRLNTENTSLRTENSHAKEEASRAVKETETLRTQNLQSQRDNERVAAEVDALKTQSQRIEADLRTARSEREQTVTQIESYKAQIQQTAADREHLKALEEEYKTLKDRNESLQKGYAVLEQNAGTSEGRLRELTTQLTALQNDNRDLDARAKSNVNNAEKYRTALEANLSDMRNLKANFEAYLESLVASFEDRQR